MPPSADPDEQGGRGRARWGLVAGAVVAALVIVLLVVGLVNRGTSTAIDDALEAGSRPAAPDLALPVLEIGRAHG